MYFCSIFQQTIAILITLGVNIIKSIYCAIKSKKWDFMFFHLYSFIYFFIIIPSKISALVTLWDMKWGTRGKTINFIYVSWSSIVWIGTMVGGFCYTIYKNYEFKINDDRYYVAFVGWMTYLCFVIVTIIVNYICRKLKILSIELESNIISERKNTNIQMSQV